MRPSFRAPLFATFARAGIELVGDHALLFVPHLDELHPQLVAYDGELALYVEAVVFYAGVDGHANVYRELVDGFEDEGVAGEGEGVEVALVVVEDDVQDAGLAEVEEVGGEAAREAEEGAVEHLAQSDRKHLGNEGVGLYAGELAQGLAQPELYGVGFVADEGAGVGEVGLGE